MIKVEVFAGPSRGVTLDLATFFQMDIYPLNYGSILPHLNNYVEDGQSLIFHQVETIIKFTSVFESPRDVVDFLIKNSNQGEVRTIVVGESIYVSIERIAYRFYEE